jgi:hypothetical protein
VRDTNLHIRLQSSEKAAIDKAAWRAGKGVSQWIRETLMAAAVGKRDPDKLISLAISDLDRARTALSAFMSGT